MKPKRRALAFDDRVEVYVDSPLMTHRVRLRRQLFARIQGNYGIYRTWANPRSFFDADGYLKTLADRPKAVLIEAIGRLIARAPEGLAALGVKGFEDEGEDDE